MARKSPMTTSINALYPNEMYELILEVAAEEERTVSWIARRAMQEYLVNHGYLELEGADLSEFCHTGTTSRKPNKDKEN